MHGTGIAIEDALSLAYIMLKGDFLASTITNVNMKCEIITFKCLFRTIVHKLSAQYEQVM